MHNYYALKIKFVSKWTSFRLKYNTGFDWQIRWAGRAKYYHKLTLIYFILPKHQQALPFGRACWCFPLSLKSLMAIKHLLKDSQGSIAKN